MRVLLVEDDETLAKGIEEALLQGSFEVSRIDDGLKADQLLAEQDFDLLLLDLTLPKMDGSEVLRRLRERGNRLPTIVLTARASVQDRVIGLDMGADDYLTKPFALDELEARVRALLRRHSFVQGAAEEGSEIVIDRSKRLARCGSQVVELSARELGLLDLLISNMGKVVKREQILDFFATGEEESLGDNAVEVYVHRLRKRLTFPSFELKTIRGLGYMLVKNN